MGMSKTTLARVIGVSKFALSDQARAILNKYGATMLLPGVSGVLRFGYQPGNYRESTGQTLAGADQQVGLVVDAARSPGPELVPVLDFTNAQWVTVGTLSAVAASGFTNASAGESGKYIAVESNKSYSISVAYTKSDATTTVGLYDGNTAATPIVTSAASAGTLVANFRSTTGQVYLRLSTTSTVSVTSFSVRELPGIHATQSTSGFQPVLRNASGIQSWQFDGTDDRLSLSAVPFQMADDHFVVVGASRGATGIARRLFHVGSAGDVQRVAVLSFSSNGTPEVNYRNDAGTLATISSSAPLGTAPVVISATSISTAINLRAESILLATGTRPSGATTLTSAAVGAHTAGAAYFNGHIHGIIFGKGAITDSELLTLERFVASLQGRTL